MLRSLPFLLAVCLVAAGALPAAAQSTATADLSLESLFASPTFYGKGFQGGRWAESGPVVRYIERDAETGATNLMEYNLETDTRVRLIDGSQLKKPDGDGLLQIEDYAYSADRRRVLLYTDSERVWRLNTKGYYYVYDVEAGTLTPVADRTAGFQMFAKFSPDGDRVAFVRDRDLFVVDLATGEETRLTDSGSPGGVINGTFDWVYEEEFGLRDGFRWSPDGRHIAFFQLDESATRDFQLTDFRTLYPEYTRFRYPKAGETNAEIRVGVIDLPSGETRFFDTDTWNEGGDDDRVPRADGLDACHRRTVLRLDGADESRPERPRSALRRSRDDGPARSCSKRSPTPASTSRPGSRTSTWARSPSSTTTRTSSGAATGTATATSISTRTTARSSARSRAASGT